MSWGERWSLTVGEVPAQSDMGGGGEVAPVGTGVEVVSVAPVLAPITTTRGGAPGVSVPGTPGGWSAVTGSTTLKEDAYAIAAAGFEDIPGESTADRDRRFRKVLVAEMRSLARHKHTLPRVVEVHSGGQEAPVLAAPVAPVQQAPDQGGGAPAGGEVALAAPGRVLSATPPADVAPMALGGPMGLVRPSPSAMVVAEPAAPVVQVSPSVG